MARRYNARLSYQDDARDILVTAVQYGLTADTTQSQVRNGQVTYVAQAPVQAGFTIIGRCYDQQELESLGKFFRGWHLAACQSSDGNVSPIEFNLTPPSNAVYGHRMSYSLVPSGGFQWFGDLQTAAPVWNMRFEIVRGLVSQRSGAGSDLIGDYIWNWDGGLVRVPDVQAEGEDAFKPRNPLVEDVGSDWFRPLPSVEGPSPTVTPTFYSGSEER